MKTNTPYPSRKIQRIRACTHQRPLRNKAQYAVSRETQYAVFKIWNQYNILEDIKRGPYSKKSLIRRIQHLDTPYPTLGYASIAEYGVSTSIGYGVSTFLPNTAYLLKQINTTYPLLLDTAYRSSETETGFLVFLFDFRAKIFLPFFRENPADIFTFVTGRTKPNFSITSNNINIELNKEFLEELQKNTYHGTYNEDVVDHIVKELVEKFFYRFYLGSYDGEDEMLDEGENWGIDPLELLSNVNTSFKNHKKVDGRTQKLIFHSWRNGNWNKRYVDNIISSNNDIMESKYENPPNNAIDLFFKAYEARDIKKQSQTKHKYCNSSNEKPNKRRCKAEKFEAIQYSLGPNEEYIAIRSYEYDIWERNEDNMSIIYQDIF
ncbi:hypothetical protein Tco_0803505 [Tanacetum coccineum]|uniref:Uncharacterized protein n=1 Tax=Tanacetum coccineum TaxID=301880 RepID=A0ABQ5A5W3_9ASTR